MNINKLQTAQNTLVTIHGGNRSDISLALDIPNAQELNSYQKHHIYNQKQCVPVKPYKRSQIPTRNIKTLTA